MGDFLGFLFPEAPGRENILVAEETFNYRLTIVFKFSQAIRLQAQNS